MLYTLRLHGQVLCGIANKRGYHQLRERALTMPVGQTSGVRDPDPCGTLWQRLRLSDTRCGTQLDSSCFLPFYYRPTALYAPSSHTSYLRGHDTIHQQAVPVFCKLCLAWLPTAVVAPNMIPLPPRPSLTTVNVVVEALGSLPAIPFWP